MAAAAAGECLMLRTDAEWYTLFVVCTVAVCAVLAFVKRYGGWIVIIGVAVLLSRTTVMPYALPAAHSAASSFGVPAFDKGPLPVVQQMPSNAHCAPEEGGACVIEPDAPGDWSTLLNAARYLRKAAGGAE